MATVPEIRIQPVNDLPVRRDGAFVLYWMIAQRRRHANFGLQRAVEWCRALDRPLCVLEALRCGHRWASDRLHRFVLDGMRDNAAAFAASGVTYHPYVEPEPDAGKGLLAALGARAAVVVTDEFPCYFLPRMVAAAGRQVDVRLEQVDGNGLLPLRAAGKVFQRAFDFRRFLQQALPAHLGEFPASDPLRVPLPAPRPLPRAIAARWPAASPALLAGEPAALAALPIDHAVPPVRGAPGGPAAAARLLRAFVRRRLARYEQDRNHPDLEGGSGLSAHLHFGHLSAHQLFLEVARHEGFSRARMRPRRDGRRGAYGLSAPAEAFLDQAVTWRELGFNFCSQRADYDRFESLPEWARRTLAAHARDRREHVYARGEFLRAATHDPLWNAAQRQLLAEGRIHNYLRMLWGKEVLEWTARPQTAWQILVELNDRHALDGRDPNSYTGIGWVFGRYDRPWAPERAVFGRVRCMTSRSTLRKVRAREFLERFRG